MAAKIVRQPNKIALLGSPTSAAAMSPGHEGAPAALRAAGLVDRLQSIGYEITDLGDDPPQVFKPDNESPRARNISGVLASLESLKPRVEQAVKSAALPLILAGDCSTILATVAGLRRYFRHVGLIYMDRDADLHTPATTSSGCLDGMVVSTSPGAALLNWCASGANRLSCASRISRSSAWIGSTRRKRKCCELRLCAVIWPMRSSGWARPPRRKRPSIEFTARVTSAFYISMWM